MTCLNKHMLKCWLAWLCARLYVESLILSSTFVTHRYFMMGGSQSGTIGTQQGLAAAGGQVALPGDGVFGPGVIGGFGFDLVMRFLLFDVHGGSVP